MPTMTTPPDLLAAAVLALAARDTDHATEANGVGYNGTDTGFGNRLAATPVERWTAGNRCEAYEMLRKYRKQLAAYGIDFDEIPAPAVDAESSRRTWRAGGHTLDFDGQLVMVAQYSDGLVAEQKAIAGRRWDGTANRFPESSAAEVAGLLARYADLGWEITPAAQAVLDAAGSAPAETTTPAKVTVSLVDGRVALAFAYDPGMVAESRAIVGRRWDVAAKLNTFPLTPGAALGIEAFLARYEPVTYTDEARAALDGLAAAGREQAVAQEGLADLSRADDSAVEIDGLGGELRPFQRAGVEYVTRAGGRSFIADDQGTGKTVQALAAIQAKDAFPAVVVCPSSVKFSWRDHVGGAVPGAPDGWLPGRTVKVLKGRAPNGERADGADVYVINYDILSGWVDELKSIGLCALILDESHYCFEGDTKVLTPAGEVAIRELVERQAPTVLTVCDDEVVERRVTDWMASPAPSHYAKICLDGGRELISTTDHPYWTAKTGWKAAGLLQAGETLRVVRAAIDADVPGEAILQPAVLGALANEPARSESTVARADQGSAGGESRRDATGRSCSNACSQSDVRPCDPSEGERDAARDGSYVPAARRQRDGAVAIGGASTGGARGRLAVQSTGIYRVASTAGTTDELQDRRSSSSADDCGRGRRTRSPFPTAAGTGPAQGRVLDLVRVASVEIHERADLERSLGRSLGDQVYNLSVDGEESYFANGVLVHNCKSGKAARTKAAKALAKAIPTGGLVLNLTGTAVLNRPIELAAQLEIIGRLDDLGGFWNFAKRYCNPPEAPIWMGDFTFKPLGDIEIGDEVIGWQKGHGRRASGEYAPRDILARSTVVAIHRKAAPIVRVRFESGRELRCTADHEWLRFNDQKHRYGRAKVGVSLVHVVEPPLAPASERAAAWVGGLYDGEGSGTYIAQYADHNPDVCERLAGALDDLGLPYTETPLGFRLTGGRQEYVNFANWALPTRFRSLDRALLTGRFKTRDRVVAIEADGYGEVIGMTTTTGNYVAWGYASKNCGAYRDNYGWRMDGASHLDELNAKLRGTCFIRRMKSEIMAELPAKQIARVAVPLSNQAEYDRAEAETVRWLVEQVEADEAFAAEIADLPEDEQATRVAARKVEVAESARRAEHLVRLNALRHVAAKGKLAAAREWVADFLEGSDEKLIVFAHHVEIQRALLSEFPDAARVLGEDSAETRAEQVARFQDDPECRLIVCSLQAAGIGITLTAASNVAFIELGWTPALHDQAEDRAHRMGQQGNVTCWYLLADGTIDDDMHDLIEQKRAVVTAATDGTAVERTESIMGALEARMLARAERR